MNGDAVERYADVYRDGGDLPRVEVYSWGAGPTYLLAEGEHRIRARLAAGFRDIKAVVRHCISKDDAERRARELAYRANVTHGAPRTIADKWATVGAAVTHRNPGCLPPRRPGPSPPSSTGRVAHGLRRSRRPPGQRPAALLPYLMFDLAPTPPPT